ncbi:hypothetical protein TNCV_2908971 [Trichonephila clavipes]|nr:hypothetical protein TNCV_2908971 [Trichonephila clavipes]
MTTKWLSKSPNRPPTCLPKMMPTWLYRQDFANSQFTPGARQVGFFLRSYVAGQLHSFDTDGWACEQLIHFGSRLQSVKECPTEAHPEHVKFL